MPDINPLQITFARVRRRWSKKRLASELGVSDRTVQNYESGASPPDPQTLTKLAKLLSFPQQFFFADDSMPAINPHAVSFRSLSKMSDAKRDCALNAGAIAIRINEWIESRFELPRAELPDLSDLSPEDAAATLRRMWGLGNAPIPNMIHLLESKGIRVFSLDLEVLDVDAFCVWHEDTPFVFLNTMKSGERSRFDAAHELGHLVRDTYSMQHGKTHGPEMEREANAFASAFLMPRDSLIAHQPAAFTLNYMMKHKQLWGVSLIALAYRYRALDLITEWHYRNLCIEIARSGYRVNEPEPMTREQSQLLSKVMEFLRSRNISRADIADDLMISVDEINALTFNLTPLSVISGRNVQEDKSRARPKLQVVR